MDLRARIRLLIMLVVNRLVRRPRGWVWLADDDQRHVHVVPINDLLVHEMDFDGDCPCGPSSQLVTRADGSDAWLFTHDSLDGRELTER